MINPTSMGFGAFGTGLTDPSVVLKRKYRWAFELETNCGGSGGGVSGTTIITPSFVKLAARPNITIEETEINFLNQKMSIPGKATWETITVTYYDVGGGGAAGVQSSALLSWLATVYNFTKGGNANNVIPFAQSSRLGGIGNGGFSNGYAAKGTLNLYDGCGDIMETWTLENCWPQAINFGELDYSSSEEATIELTIRYSNAIYEVGAGCGTAIIMPCCGGCK